MSLPTDNKKGDCNASPDVCDQPKIGQVLDENMNQVESDTYLATQKSLVRKLDMTLMPMVFILYLFNYLDRNNIS